MSSSRVPASLSSRRLGALDLICRSLIHVNFSLAHSERHGSSFNAQHLRASFLLIKEASFPPVMCLAPLISLYFYIFFFLSTLCWLYHSSFVVWFQVRNCQDPYLALRLLLRCVFGILGLCWFQIHLWFVFSNSVKYATGILIGIALNLHSNCASVPIFPVLVIFVQEQGPCFHFLMISSISFSRLLWFPM